MHAKRRFLAAVLACAGLAFPVRAEDPAEALSSLRGAWILEVPASCHLLLGARQIRTGDVLTAGQLEQLRVYAGSDPAISILPIRASGPAPARSFRLRRSRNEAPIAADSDAETYRNLPREALLDVRDPEGDSLTYQLVRPPRRGRVILRRDGSFLYTPEKNKIGTDSFVYTATDPGGLVSRPATVTIRIHSTAADRPYADTAGSGCSFAAEWLRETGIFVGETVDGQACFSPEKPVSRGQFLAMLMAALKLPADRTSARLPLPPETPLWLRPYLRAALRAGIIRPDPRAMASEEPLTLVQAAGLACDAAALARPVSLTGNKKVPTAAGLLALCGARDTPGRILTRADAARILCSISH